MENISKQHSQVPNEMGIEGLEPKDQLIYAIIKMYDNEKKEVYPSLQKIAEIANMSINTVRKSIQALVDKHYITIKKVGRNNWYLFNEYIKFEPFSPEFLKNDKISSLAKAYVVASQQYMFKDIEGIGKLSYSNRELSEKINMPIATISKCNKELVKSGYMEIIRNASKDLETGIFTDSKIFKLGELCQGVVWALNKHEDDIIALKAEQELTRKEMDELKRQLRELQEKEKLPTEYKM